MVYKVYWTSERESPATINEVKVYKNGGIFMIKADHYFDFDADQLSELADFVLVARLATGSFFIKAYFTMLLAFTICY